MNALPSPNTFELLPTATEAEQALLGGIFLQNDAFHLVSDFLAPEHFYEPLNRQIFKIIGDTIRAGKRATPITVKTFLPADQKVGEKNILQYLAALVTEATTVINIPDYAQEIVVAYGRRASISAAEQLKADCSNGDFLLSDALSEAQSALTQIELQMTDQDPSMTMSEALDGQLRAIERAYQSGERVGTSTGLEFIDRLTGDWFDGQLIIIGGATKMGKTALAMQALFGVARTKKVLLFSLEMTPHQLAARLLAQMASVPTHRQNIGKISDAEYELMTDARDQVSEVMRNITIVRQEVTIEKINTIATREKKLNGVGLIAVDHIGLIEPDFHDKRKAEWELGQQSTKMLKKLAMKHECITLGLSQLKKNSQHVGFGTGSFDNQIKSAFMRPKYSDLVGAIERDADHVLMPFRPEARLSQMEPQKATEEHLRWEQVMSEQRGKAQIILALSRERQWPLVENVDWIGRQAEFRSIPAPDPGLGI